MYNIAAMCVTSLSFGITSFRKTAFAVRSLASTATGCHRAHLSQFSHVSYRIRKTCMHVTVCRPLSWQCLGSLTPPVSLGSVLVCVDLCLDSVLAVFWQGHGRTRHSPGGGA
jgi:hypothetical protein